MKFNSTRKCAEWCSFARHILQWLAGELHYFSPSLSVVVNDYYDRKSCGEVEVAALLLLTSELFTVLKEKELAAFNTPMKYWEALSAVTNCYNNGQAANASKYIK